MSKYRFPLHLQLFAEDEGADASVVADPVDADPSEGQLDPTTLEGNPDATPAGEPVKPDPKVGEAIKREVERREAKLREQYEQQY
ncbi:hypothetical protein ABTF40_19250, partial [Acinetobacter baumannii]